ncbi:MAG: DUF1963 domain-containing protein [Bacteroidota bacterium]
MENILEKVRQFILEYDIPEDKAGADVFYYQDKELYKIQLNNEALTRGLYHEILLLGVELQSDDLPLGSSKIYGEPHWPKDWEWPEHNYFIAQLNLEDLYPYDLEDLLPKEGMLYFFQECSFYDDEVPLKAYYYHGPFENLAQTPWPPQLLEKAKDPYTGYEKLLGSPIYRVRFKSDLNIAIRSYAEGFSDIGNDDLGISKFINSILEEITKKYDFSSHTLMSGQLFDFGASLGFLGGNPIFCQGEEYPFFEEFDKEKELERAQIYKTEAEEILLFRFACFEGYANLFITKEDLKNKVFENTESHYSGG